MASLWASFEQSDLARSIPLGNRSRPPGFSLAELPPRSLEGRVVLITGATAGIGAECARAVAAAGARTVIGCRDERKGELLRSEILQAQPGATVSTLLLDLRSRASIERAICAMKARHSALHILMNNGGIPASAAPLRLADGLEECFQANAASAGRLPQQRDAVPSLAFR